MGEDKSGRAASLTYNPEIPGSIVAYELPRIDGLPVRRELLRFLEEYSKSHPRCKPGWITAGQDTGKALGWWKLVLSLSGSGCPAKFVRFVNPERTVFDPAKAGSLEAMNKPQADKVDASVPAD